MGVPSKFINSLKRRLAKASHFEVNITGGTFRPNDMHLRCHQAVLPGITAATSQYGTGMPEKNNPYRATFEDVAFSFYCSDDLTEKVYFDRWMQNIFPTMDTMSRGKKETTPHYLDWPIGYRNNFTRNIEIIKIQQTGEVISKYILHHAFPTIINDTTLEWGDEEVLKLEITFSYDWWTWAMPEQTDFPVDKNWQTIDKTGTKFVEDKENEWRSSKYAPTDISNQERQINLEKKAWSSQQFKRKKLRAPHHISQYRKYIKEEAEEIGEVKHLTPKDLKSNKAFVYSTCN
jgi:hypothetical protein